MLSQSCHAITHTLCTSVNPNCVKVAALTRSAALVDQSVEGVQVAANLAAKHLPFLEASNYAPVDLLTLLNNTNDTLRA